MKKVLSLTILMLISNTVLASDGSWGYSGHTGPENWAKLTPENGACAGKNQSPINLTGFVKSDLQPIKFNYSKGGNEILNNGHTVQVNYEKGSSIRIDDVTFSLLQFHFHAPSENNINGISYPLEAHFVHADKDGNLAVVALMYKEGATNRELEKAFSQMPRHAGDKSILSAAVSADNMLPVSRDYYRFNGSLTTPPCSEGVRWMVMKSAVTASKLQILAFKNVLHESNNRPVQALNARKVMQ